MSINHAALDEAVKRHPLIIKRLQFALEATPAIPVFGTRPPHFIRLTPDEYGKIRNEYRLLIQEHAKRGLREP